MKTIPELKTYQIKLLKKYCERILSFNIYGNEIVKLLNHTINICDTELYFRVNK